MNQPPESKTPETDKALALQDCCHCHHVHGDFARSLELRLNEALANVQAVSNELHTMAASQLKIAKERNEALAKLAEATKSMESVAEVLINGEDFGDVASCGLARKLRDAAMNGGKGV